MNGQMKNFSIVESSEKDKLAKNFIKSVNPYRGKPSLGIDLRKLSKYAKEFHKSGNSLSDAEIKKFKLEL